MPRYYFIVTYADKELGIPGGSILPGDKAAIEAARKVIDELLAKRPEDPNPTIVVKNTAGEIVYRYPSN